MSLFSNCWDCAICGCGSGCLAGNGDDDYIPATLSQVIERLDTDLYQNHKQQMINYLKEKYDYDYVEDEELKRLKKQRIEEEKEVDRKEREIKEEENEEIISRLSNYNFEKQCYYDDLIEELEMKEVK